VTEAPPRARGAGAWPFVAGALAGLALVALVELVHPTGLVPGRDGAPALDRTGAAPRGASLDALTLADTAHRVVDLAAARAPQVVMLASTTCGVCRRALADFREAEREAPLARLTLVMLEGADSGVVHLAHARVTAGRVLGPANEGARATMTFQFPGTPVFFALDAEARVVATLPGYPGREAFAPWVAVMQGRRAAP
jgi:hypothetical protein